MFCLWTSALMGDPTGIGHWHRDVHPLNAMSSAIDISLMPKIILPLQLLLFVVETFQHGEGFFLFAVVADDALEIPAVLNARQLSARGTEVAQNPRRATTEAGNFFQNRQRAFVNVLLILLAEPRQRVRMKTLLCVRAEFTDDNRLVVFDAPAEPVNFIRQAVIPAGVFIETAQVGEFAERIVHDF